MTWHEGRMVALDTETTGVNPLDARIVTAAVAHINPGTRPSIIEWVINPGIPIPDEAAQVHGWTNLRLDAYLAGAPAIRVTGQRRQQLTVEGALHEIAAQAAVAMKAEAPLVVHNAAYDLTLLETELARNGIDTLASRPTGIKGVVDPMVIEKAKDPYRKVRGGCRCGCGATDKTLTGLCLHYGVRHAGAHGASADAVAAVRLLGKLVEGWPEIARWRLGTLYQHQVGWAASQKDSLRAYFDKAGIDHDGCDPGWPIHTSLTTEAVAS